MDVLDAMRGRTASRAFLNRPVESATVEAILEAARWAPSGANTQPWRVAVLAGAPKQRLSEALLAARAGGRPARPEYDYYPREWFEPYKARRRASGLAMYGALGIDLEDKPAREQAWNRNYQFFGAPTGLLFFIDPRLAKGSWLDLGMFIQNVMLAARGLGLATCPQASIAEYPDIVRRELGIEKAWRLVCGMALGHPDPEAPVNRYRTEREPVSSFTTWYT